MHIVKNELYIPQGRVEVILRDGKTGAIKAVDEYKNMVVTAGKNSIADRLRGTDSKGVITYCAVGTGGTAPTEDDTELENELGRKLVSVRSVDGNDATFETFFTTSEVNGSLTEAGLFGDAASATADSGTLFCRVQISRTKTSNDTLSLVWTVTIG
ncbi:MAG: hypothetical protein WC871_02375 [Bacteroidales bacterium]|jgi:hypothetical protein